MVGESRVMDEKRLPYEPKSIYTLGNICCMRCGKYYSKEQSINSIFLEEFWDYCSIKCALDDEIAFEAFFASLDNKGTEDNIPKNERFYWELAQAIRQHKNCINIDSYISKAKRFKATRLVKILKNVEKST